MTADISVIIPVHNGERFLAQALASVEEQTLQPLETIVVDDGSTDGGAAVAERRRGARVLSLAHRGVSAARNAGVAAARGEWLAFLDADDRWLPAKLERQLQMHASTGSPIQLSRKRLLIEGDPPAWYSGPGHGTVLPSYEPSGWLIPKSEFVRVGPFNEEMELGEDTEWLARATDLGLAMTMCDEPLFERRIHAANASARLPGQAKLMIDILRSSVRRKLSRETLPQ